MLSVETQQKLCSFFRNLADLELNVESYRQKLATLYDFEPYAAFCRLDADVDKKLYTIDFYNFMKENDRNQYSLKDCQLMMGFYDLDNGGSLSYGEFMKFILPCDNEQLRTDVCQRKTYEVDIKAGKKLYPTVETAMADYFEREINIHIKLEMLKQTLHRAHDWNTKAAFNLIDSQRQGSISHFNLYGFCNQNGFDASDDELIAIIRRIEGSGNGQIDCDEFACAIDPIIIKQSDIAFVEDEGQHLARNKEIDEKNTVPFLKKMGEKQPIGMNNSLEMNLQLYDQYQTLQTGTMPQGALPTGATPLRQVDYPMEKEQPYGGKNPGSTYKMKVGRQDAVSSPLRKTAVQSSMYPMGEEGPERFGNTSVPFNPFMDISNGDDAAAANPFPRGPPMTDMTNIHSGNGVPSYGSQIRKVGELSPDDERELVQLFFEMIVNEKELEAAKMRLAEQGDFNLMDAFQMIDAKSLGWVSGPQVLTFLIESGVFAHKDDVYSWCRRFDRDNDSKILYSDFCEAITPKDSYYSHALSIRQAKWLHVKDIPKLSYFTEQTRDCYFQCFKTHFLIDQKVEVAKKRCTRKPSFNIHDAFATVDTFKQGMLNRDDLKRLMQKNGFHPTETELTWLTARFDRNLTGTITYQEFMDEVLPATSLLGDVASINLLRQALSKN